MKTYKINNILFKGQYADALLKAAQGHAVTMQDFKNGSWEATVKLSRFMELVSNANLHRTIKGSSLRTTEITIGITEEELE